ncbi:MAG: response regulator [Syntrophaceae bacterium]
MDNGDILLIEDNRHDVELILDAMSGHYIIDKVCVLRDGAEALNYFFGPEGCFQSAIAHLPKLILLDLKLPKVSGLEFLKHIRSDERTQHIPTVIFTSSNEAEDRIKSYSLGANSYIVKPLDADTFSRFVTDIISYWVSMNRTVFEN